MVSLALCFHLALNVFLWFNYISFRFPGKEVGVRFSGQAATTVAAPAEEVKKVCFLILSLFGYCKL